jgi:hypothetical protein
VRRGKNRGLALAVLSALTLVALALAAWLVFQWREPRTYAPVARGEPTIEPPPPPGPAPKHRPRPATPQTSSPVCKPSAAQRCVEGDVWLVDGCGNKEEKLEECAEQRCLDDDCELPPVEPCREPAEGRCEGDVVRLCVAGRTRDIDCAARGLRCGVGDEGAECLPVIPLAERCTAPTHCAGNVLVRCDDGQATRVDCAALRAQCLRLPGLDKPTCVEVRAVELSANSCGPCGCVGKNSGETECDGRDEDSDGLVDEGVDCGPVPVVAFVVTDSAGQTSHAREDVEAEIAQVNRMFWGRARDDGEEEGAGLSFVLADVVPLAAPSLLELDQDELSRLASGPEVHPQRDAFYIPIVFTDSIVAGGETPKPGISTLPNGTCGGMQEGKGPDVGLLAVAKARYATTVAHEIGHFLGLCHTHDRQEAEPFVAYPNAQTGKLQICEQLCLGQGDGVCDTPYDPGPELCSYGPDCHASCRVDAAPDAKNLMGYYASCRSAFSPEQMRLMQHTLALRRGWQRCLDTACPCRLGGSECPAAMSCRLGHAGGESVTRCALDGPRAPGADCRDTSDCGQGSLCLIEQGTGAQRCARPCLESGDGCTCTKVADDLSVCVQDLRKSG